MSNYLRANESENGFIVEGAAGFFSGSGSPNSDPGLDGAPLGSQYFRTDLMETWRKEAVGWVKIGSSGHLKLIDSLESEASESRSQSTYGGGVSLSTLNLVNGTEYIWQMFCEHRVEDSNSPVFVEFSVGGSVVGEQYLEVTSNTNNNDYEPRFCIKKLSNVSGTVTSTIKHKDGGDGSVSFVRKLRILVFEVLQ